MVLRREFVRWAEEHNGAGVNRVRIERFEDIEAWQLGRDLTGRVYAVTKIRPFARNCALTDQIRRAAMSVMHNVAESFDSGSDKEFVRFLSYAQRSCTEVRSQLYVALDQQYVSLNQFDELSDLAREAHARIGGFIKYLKRSERSATRVPTKDQGPGTGNAKP